MYVYIHSTSNILLPSIRIYAVYLCETRERKIYIYLKKKTNLFVIIIVSKLYYDFKRTKRNNHFHEVNTLIKKYFIVHTHYNIVKRS